MQNHGKIISETVINIIMNAVESSNISHIGYNPEHQYLRVNFKNGHEWLYVGVPAEVWAAFSASASKGSFLATRIKGFYEAVKMGEKK
jgi:KTSC domain